MFSRPSVAGLLFYLLFPAIGACSWWWLAGVWARVASWVFGGEVDDSLGGVKRPLFYVLIIGLYALSFGVMIYAWFIK